MKVNLRSPIQYPLFLCGMLLAVVACQTNIDPNLSNETQSIYLDSELAQVIDMMDEAPEEAIKKCDNVINIAASEGLSYYGGKAKWYKGYIYDEIIEDVSKAYYNYQEALKDLTQTDSSTLKMKVYNNLGLLYRFYSQYDAAISNYEAAMKFEEDLPIKQRSNLYYNYAVALKLKGDSISFNQAEDAFTKSLELAHKINDHENIASVSNQIGLMYNLVGDYDMSRIAYRNNIRTYQHNSDLTDYVGKAYHGIGVTYMEEGNLNEAIQAFEKALIYKIESGSIFITKYDLGTSLLKAGHTKDAIDAWKSALKEKHKKNDIDQVKIYSDLSIVLESSELYEEALGYSKIYNSNVQEIILEVDKYKKQNNQVLFADIVKDYDEFNQSLPFYSKYPWILALLLLLTIPVLYFLVTSYYKSKITHKVVSDTVSRIQSEFQHIKVD